jgi:hypothetical protein
MKSWCHAILQVKKVFLKKFAESISFGIVFFKKWKFEKKIMFLKIHNFKG